MVFLCFLWGRHSRRGQLETPDGMSLNAGREEMCAWAAAAPRVSPRGSAPRAPPFLPLRRQHVLCLGFCSAPGTFRVLANV